MSLRVHVDQLHNLMNEWLDDITAISLRIVVGGPGSGKSSFAKAFAVEVSDQLAWRVVFIELQNLAFDKGDLERRIGEYLTSSALYSAIDPEGTAGFPQNPLSWRAASSDSVLHFRWARRTERVRRNLCRIVSDFRVGCEQLSCQR